MSAGERGPSPVPVGAPTREKLLALLGAAGLAGVLLLVGLGLALYYGIHPNPAQPDTANQDTAHQDTAHQDTVHTAHTDSASPPAVAGAPHSQVPLRAAGTGPGDVVRARRDELAARPMRAGSAADAQPSVLSTRDPGFIVLPPSTTTGPVGVAAGFDHTPAGALAQLAAIDTAALDSASLGGVRAVIQMWAAPGGPTAATWSAVQAMADFLTAAGLPAGRTTDLALSATPMMGLVKATDGGDWVVACVDFEVDATLARTARVAVADCQRMSWAGNRWVIGPGSEPATPPSIWPGTDAAIDAGYKELHGG
jgi:hypothetical protein